MTDWQTYRKNAPQEMRPYIPGEDLTGVSVSERDTPETGGMIARGADDGALWYVSKRFFEESYSLECDCDGAIFVKHIQEHLRSDQQVICKICGLSVKEIEEANGAVINNLSEYLSLKKDHPEAASALLKAFGRGKSNNS